MSACRSWAALPTWAHSSSARRRRAGQTPVLAHDRMDRMDRPTAGPATRRAIGPPTKTALAGSSKPELAEPAVKGAKAVQAVKAAQLRPVGPGRRRSTTPAGQPARGPRDRAAATPLRHQMPACQARTLALDARAGRHRVSRSVGGRVTCWCSRWWQVFVANVAQPTARRAPAQSIATHMAANISRSDGATIARARVRLMSMVVLGVSCANDSR